MKQATATLLLLLALTAFFREGVVLLVFKANQPWIAKTLCINRMAPEKGCNGHCVLMQKLAERTPVQPVFPTAYEDGLNLWQPEPGKPVLPVILPATCRVARAAQPAAGHLTAVFHPPQPGC